RALRVEHRPLLRRLRPHRPRLRRRVRAPVPRMTLVVYVGGARSGKSRLAVERASAEAAPVVFVATGEAGDDEMAERIARHRAERPGGWSTVEEPLELARALRGAPA